MSLSTIRRGKQSRPPRVIVYGQEGIGKSTFGACAPSPVFLQTEDGLSQIDCDSFPLCDSYGVFLDQLGAVVQESHDYKTAVVDSADWLEKLIHTDVAREHNKASIEEIGYAKGPQFALRQWKEVLDGLDACRARGMAIVVIAHAKVERFNDPERESYDRYSLRLHKDAAAMLSEWADAVLFATRRVRVEKEDKGFNRTRSIIKAIGADGGERILRCTGSPACVAKNRYDMPSEIPLLWDEAAKYFI